MIVNIFFLIVFMAVLTLFSCIEYQKNTSALNHTIYVGFANNPFEFNSAPLNRFSRKKRSLIELYNMVSCATGCNPLVYKGYGCFCGFLGSGVPTDAIDSCCEQHDACYGTAACFFPFHYTTQYYWKCIDGIPYCVNWNQKQSCSNDLCECDRKLSECLKEMSCPRNKVACPSSWIW